MNTKNWLRPMHDYERAANTLEAGRIRRYHAVPTVEAQTVGQHSWGVLVSCLYVTNQGASRDLLIAAALHDTAELYTGDMPYTVKRGVPELKELLGRMETFANENLVMPTPGAALNPHDQAVLKLCDTLDGLIWCRKTELTGPVRERWREALNRCFDKFQSVLSDEELLRASTLVNEENFYPTI